MSRPIRIRCSTNSVTRRTPSQRTIVRRDFVADEITENRRMPGMLATAVRTDLDDLIAGAFARRRNSMCFAHGKVISTRIPAAAQRSRNQRGGSVINADDVDSDLAHLSADRAAGLFGRAEIMSVRIRPERPVGHAFDKKLAIAFEEEFGDGADGSAVVALTAAVS